MFEGKKEGKHLHFWRLNFYFIPKKRGRAMETLLLPLPILLILLYFTDFGMCAFGKRGLDLYLDGVSAAAEARNTRLTIITKLLKLDCDDRIEISEDRIKTTNPSLDCLDALIQHTTDAPASLVVALKYDFRYWWEERRVGGDLAESLSVLSNQLGSRRLLEYLAVSGRDNCSLVESAIPDLSAWLSNKTTANLVSFSQTKCALSFSSLSLLLASCPAPSSTVRDLNLSGGTLSISTIQDSIDFIFLLVSKFPLLQKLDLSEAGIPRMSMGAFVKTLLAQFPRLEALKLSRMAVSYFDLEEIGEACSGSRSLRELDLSFIINSVIPETGLIAFLKNLGGKSSSLERLNLQELMTLDSLSQAGHMPTLVECESMAGQILEAIEDIKSLTYINLPEAIFFFEAILEPDIRIFHTDLAARFVSSLPSNLKFRIDGRLASFDQIIVDDECRDLRKTLLKKRFFDNLCKIESLAYDIYLAEAASDTTDDDIDLYEILSD